MITFSTKLVIMAAPAEAEKKVQDIYHAATGYKFKDAASLIDKNISSTSNSPSENLAVINYYWWKLISGDNNSGYAQKIYSKVDELRNYYTNHSTAISDEMLFYITSVYAFEARVCLLDHSYRKALSSLSKYYSTLKPSFGKESKYPELNLTSGLFYFFTAYARERMPLFSPILRNYYAGDKQTGYDMIVKASKLGNEIVSEQSMYFLMKINFDIYENFQQSELYCRKLISIYPANLLYQYYLFKIFLATDQKMKARDQILVIKYYADNNHQLTYDESTFYTNMARVDFEKKYN
jgi:hypothetical protein